MDCKLKLEFKIDFNCIAIDITMKPKNTTSAAAFKQVIELSGDQFRLSKSVIHCVADIKLNNIKAIK